eukprot:CAMPEP_0117653364 /NCGR_PEP_ID=MMETSP0804-20121206/3146_1 /TAXON_ID=1074897 /ORGANISM="Tetraselmis astigmatica, Strain CCMP880" /LENGTH=107 /DNA_ID=CAMNT_0005459523 /DNA_START=2095 /DNA_END=2415 /DNA_ORIENTATION=+
MTCIALLGDRAPTSASASTHARAVALRHHAASIACLPWLPISLAVVSLRRPTLYACRKGAVANGLQARKLRLSWVRIIQLCRDTVEDQTAVSANCCPLTKLGGPQLS